MELWVKKNRKNGSQSVMQLMDMINKIFIDIARAENPYGIVCIKILWEKRIHGK